VPSASGVNVAGASTANLRGLGSDATLTLLNGHRLAYNGTRQGVDLSSVPFGMVDRVEVVADGASALYGSDAVAGVVNIILKRDYEGLQTSANLGGATDGGDFQQQYGVVTGHKWSTGGFVAAYEYGQNSDIFSSQRSFTAGRPNIIIYPAMHHHAAAFSAHQALTDTLTFEVDALYNKRWSASGVTLSTDGSWDTAHQESYSSSRSGAIAPSLKLQLGKDWHLALSGVYGTETVHLTNDIYVGTTLSTVSSACYCNEGKSVELAADGRLFDLPAGPVKVATGAGYRTNSMNLFAGQGNALNFIGSQSSTYAYGEVSIPVVSPKQSMAGIDHLSLSGALRYERYPGIGSVATPKLGIIYAPVPDLSIKGSWGAPSGRQPSINNTRGSRPRSTPLPAEVARGTHRTPRSSMLPGATSTSSRSGLKTGRQRWISRRIRCPVSGCRPAIFRRCTRIVSSRRSNIRRRP
jgi:outer membrane receptor protein involved in Fe transport